MPNIFVIYHADCPDGFGAAYAAWKKFGDTAVYWPYKHGMPYPSNLDQGSEVYVLDFSFPKEQIAQAIALHKVTIIDHHKSAQEELKDFLNLPFIHFNMEKSGAVMAWEYFHHFESVPMLLRYIQAQDLWQWDSLPCADEVCSALSLQPFDFNTWDKLLVTELVDMGRTVVAVRNKVVADQIAKHAYARINGHIVPVVATPTYVSHTGNALCLEYPSASFAATYSWSEREDGLIQEWELRSVGDFDVSVVARRYGGGGHRNAAGFFLKDLESFIVPIA